MTQKATCLLAFAASATAMCGARAPVRASETDSKIESLFKTTCVCDSDTMEMTVNN